MFCSALWFLTWLKWCLCSMSLPGRSFSPLLLATIKRSLTILQGSSYPYPWWLIITAALAETKYHEPWSSFINGNQQTSSISISSINRTVCGECLQVDNRTAAFMGPPGWQYNSVTGELNHCQFKLSEFVHCELPPIFNQFWSASVLGVNH